MEELIRTIIDNGLGVASFVALIYFANTYVKTQGDVLKSIQETLQVMCESLRDLTGRVEVLEQKEENQTNKLQELTNNKNNQIIEEQKTYAQQVQTVQQPTQVVTQQTQYVTPEQVQQTVIPTIQPVSNYNQNNQM